MVEVVEVMRWVGDGCVFQIDFEKTYNCMDWDFLFFMIKKMGFGTRWIGWIRRCVTCARVSVLVNGSAGEEFWMNKGLRQRCPTSPLLFNLVVETLPISVSQFEEL